MFKKLFSGNSPYTKQARFTAILWTLLILVGCFWPGDELPKVDVPLADKWVHFALFGGFAFFWLLARPGGNVKNLLRMFVISVAFGGSIEIMQGILTFLHRGMELNDAIADSIGALIGIGVYSGGWKIAGGEA